MGSKNKTVSFRVDEDTFEALREIAEERNLSLSAVFRDYVDTLVKYDGQVSIEPERDGDVEDFPPTVEVPKSFVREHERLELEAEHLREQLEEHKRYIDALRDKLESNEGIDEVVHLDDLDGDEEEFHLDDDEPFQFG
jgi:predicted RNase H-like nuclease (RuvC/YqgF family)